MQVTLERPASQPEIPKLHQAIGELVVGHDESVVLEQDTTEEADIGVLLEPTDEKIEIPLEVLAAAEEVEQHVLKAAVVDAAAFTAIAEKFEGPLFNFIYYKLGDYHRAQELLQDTFLKAWRASASMSDAIENGHLSAWLYRIASNTLTDELRKRRLIHWESIDQSCQESDSKRTLYVSTAPQSIAETTPDPRTSNLAGETEDRDKVTYIFNHLPPKYSACLWLYEHDGLSCTEIGTVLDISPSAVKMRLMRARERAITLINDYEMQTAA